MYVCHQCQGLGARTRITGHIPTTLNILPDHQYYHLLHVLFSNTHHLNNSFSSYPTILHRRNCFTDFLHSFLIFLFYFYIILFWFLPPVLEFKLVCNLYLSLSSLNFFVLFHCFNTVSTHNCDQQEV